MRASRDGCCGVRARCLCGERTAAKLPPLLPRERKRARGSERASERDPSVREPSSVEPKASVRERSRA